MTTPLCTGTASTRSAYADVRTGTVIAHDAGVVQQPRADLTAIVPSVLDPPVGPRPTEQSSIRTTTKQSRKVHMRGRQTLPDTILLDAGLVSSAGHDLPSSSPSGRNLHMQPPQSHRNAAGLAFPSRQSRWPGHLVL